MAKKHLRLKTSVGMSEKEALELLSTAQSRVTGAFDAIRNRIFEMTSKGQHYGLIQAETVSGEKLSPPDCKKVVSGINTDLKRRGFKYSIRYIPAREGFLFVPLAKIEEFFSVKS